MRSATSCRTVNGCEQCSRPTPEIPDAGEGNSPPAPLPAPTIGENTDMLKRTRKGMTLLELIVVIVILGILAAIAIPTFAQVISKSKTNVAETSASALDHDAMALAAFDQQGAGYVGSGTSFTVTSPSTSAYPYVAQAASELPSGATVVEGVNAGNFVVTADGASVCYTPSTVDGQSGTIVSSTANC
jgi:MSHA pilin protein MshA